MCLVMRMLSLYFHYSNLQVIAPAYLLDAGIKRIKFCSMTSFYIKIVGVVLANL